MCNFTMHIVKTFTCLHKAKLVSMMYSDCCKFGMSQFAYFSAKLWDEKSTQFAHQLFCCSQLKERATLPSLTVEMN